MLSFSPYKSISYFNFTGIKDGQVVFINSLAGHRVNSFGDLNIELFHGGSHIFLFQIMADGYMVMYNSVKLALTCLVDGWRREVSAKNIRYYIHPTRRFILVFSQARRLGNNKIRISQICPGLVESEIIYARDPEKVDYSKKV